MIAPDAKAALRGAIERASALGAARERKSIAGFLRVFAAGAPSVSARITLLAAAEVIEAGP